ncbi:MAG: aromatic ring-hydroxylating dioxygenase subunit alpha, partial [Chloroflexota bacterium]
MLTTAENERLTQVGPGTPMGELMRRYWHPIAAVGELDAKPTKPVRILGEDLVLYRDNSGTYGLIDR